MAHPTPDRQIQQLRILQRCILGCYTSYTSFAMIFSRNKVTLFHPSSMVADTSRSSCHVLKHGPRELGPRLHPMMLNIASTAIEPENSSVNVFKVLYFLDMNSRLLENLYSSLQFLTLLRSLESLRHEVLCAKSSSVCRSGSRCASSSSRVREHIFK